MVHVICYVAGVVVQDLTCNISRTSFSLSETLAAGRFSVTSSSCRDREGREERVVQTWNVSELVPYARPLASFLVGTLILQGTNFCSDKVHGCTVGFAQRKTARMNEDGAKMCSRSASIIIT